MTLPSLSPSKAIFSLVLIAALLAGGLASPRAGLAAGAVARPHGAPVHTFEVIYGADSPDKNPGDGVCASTDDDLCTLRAAIEEANASAGEDRIQFRFCGYASKVLYPNSPLPAITEAATIDGDASGIPNCIQRSITLDGSQAGAEADGLRLQGDGIIVKALNIYSFQGNGISIEGDHNQVNASYLGTDRSGAAGLGNWKNGILIHSGDANQVNASILSGNLLSGVLIEGGTNSLVTANKIGLWSPTDSALPNQVNGVRVFGGSGHTIGGDGGLGNLIAGNGQAGVYLGANASQVAVYNNTIGVDADGSVIISNGTVGIEVRGAYNSIGSDQLGTGNLVSGNRSGILLTGSAAHHNVLYHNRVGLDGTSQDVLGNVNDGIILQNGAAANQLIKNDVGGNGRYGIHIAGAGTPPPCDANYLSDNFVGSIYTERAGLGNGADGIYIKGSSCNHVRNNKSGFNANYGIFLDGAAPITATIEQNTCSYNLSGGIAIGSDGNRVEQNVVGYNGLIGMLISGSHNHIAYTKAVGGMVETQLYGIVVGGNDNTLTGFGKDHDGVSQNSLAGIVLNGNQNRVYNYSILDNFGSGVQVTGYDNIIGSEDKETYIDGNVWGIVLEANAMNTQVINTRIGSDRFGFSPLGNGIAGILIRGRFSIIGGSPARRNVIANTQETGILLTDDAYNNQIIDNRIGNNFGAMPNGLHGIQISGNARDNLIQNNLIASNLGAGVRIEAGTGNRLSANQIYDNQGLGIDLGPSGVTNNDSGDVDSGGNGLQNYP